MKFLLGLASASLLSAGLVATAPAATAAYPNTIATFCSANANAKVVNVRVRAAGNKAPRGTATIRISKGGDVVRSTSVDFNGGDYSRKVLGKRLGKGRYTVTVKANPSNDAFRNCSNSFGVRVR